MRAPLSLRTQVFGVAPWLGVVGLGAVWMVQVRACRPAAPRRCVALPALLARTMAHVATALRVRTLKWKRRVRPSAAALRVGQEAADGQRMSRLTVRQPAAGARSLRARRPGAETAFCVCVRCIFLRLRCCQLWRGGAQRTHQRVRTLVGALSGRTARVSLAFLHPGFPACALSLRALPDPRRGCTTAQPSSAAVIAASRSPLPRPSPWLTCAAGHPTART